jgi:hypothetical protein
MANNREALGRHFMHCELPLVTPWTEHSTQKSQFPGTQVRAQFTTVMRMR